jgi:carboxypeptidase family protein
MQLSLLAPMAVVAALAACNTAEIGPSAPPADSKTAVFLTDAPWRSRGATGQYRAVRVRFDPDRSGMTDRNGGHPVIAWQAKGDAPSLFSLVEEPMAIDENGEDIVIDFDVGRSFLPDSSSDGFIFIPFLRAITRAGSGSILGTVVNLETGHPIPLAAVSIHYDFDTASALGPLVSTTRTDESGTFTASFLRPGRYTVLPEDLARGTAGPTRDIQVNAGETADAGTFEF